MTAGGAVMSLSGLTVFVAAWVWNPLLSWTLHDYYGLRYRCWDGALGAESDD